ncbi:MAG: hypothetical protein ACRDTG_33000 [Pseudonocardiaceae bacterium]
MAEPENTTEDTQLDSESGTEEPTVSGTEEPTVDTDGAPWPEAAAADYQERLSEFDKVESEPIVSASTESPPSADDLEVSMPEDQGS